MRWHEESLEKGALDAARRLAPVLAERFYLAGGTGLALQLGHRVSLDLDLFSSECALLEGDREKIARSLASSGPLSIRESKDGTVLADVGSTHVSLRHFPYPRLEPSNDWRGLPVASLSDIGAMKLSAIVNRGSKRDFLDVYVLARRLGLASLFETSARKFKHHSDFPLVASKALVYFEDADAQPMPRLLQPADWAEIKSYFEREVPRLLRKRIG